MQLLKFMEAVDLAAKPETERATLLCFYHYKEDGETTFTMAKIVLWLEECNFSKPNTSRLKEHLTKGKGIFPPLKNNQRGYRVRSRCSSVIGT